jgi:hypothetical protein
MLPKNTRYVALCLLAFVGTGCGSMGKMFKKSKEEKKPAEAAVEAPKQDAAIGLVEMVNPEQQFVLVRTEGRMALSPGTILVTQPQTGTAARLIVTPESKQNFISADIVEGFPKRGDMVIFPVSSQVAAQAAAAGPPGSPGAPGAAGAPGAMSPGGVPSPGSSQQPGALLPASAVPPVPEGLTPGTALTPANQSLPSVAPVQKVPEVSVPPEVKGSPTDTLDALPPPIN